MRVAPLMATFGSFRRSEKNGYRPPSKAWSKLQNNHQRTKHEFLYKPIKPGAKRPLQYAYGISSAGGIAAKIPAAQRAATLRSKAPKIPGANAPTPTAKPSNPRRATRGYTSEQSSEKFHDGIAVENSRRERAHPQTATSGSAGSARFTAFA